MSIVSFRLYVDRLAASWAQWSGVNNNRRIFATAVSVGAVSFFVKVFQLCQELIVAYHFGRSDVYDSFVIAYLLPAFLISAFTSIYGAAFVPLFLKVWTQHGKERAQEILSGALLGNTVLLAAGVVVLWCVGKPVVALLATGFANDKLTQTHQLFLALIPAFFLGGTIAMMTALLNANEKFNQTALSPLFRSAAIAAMLLLFGKTLGVYALVFGVWAGLFAELIYLRRMALRSGWQLQFSRRWDGQTARLLANQMIPMVGAVLFTGAQDIVDNAMASMLSAGSVSAFAYGTRISLAVMGLAAAALGTVVLPRFSMLLAEHRWSEIKKILRTYNRLIFLASIPVVALMGFFSEQLVVIFYQRGAFMASDTELVSRVQILHVLQMPFYIAGILNVRLISAAGKNQWLMVISMAALLVNIIGNYVLMKVLGVAGIALATTLVICMTWLATRIVALRLIRQNAIDAK